MLGREAGVLSRSLYGNNASRASVDIRGFGAASTQNTLILVDGRRLNDVDLSAVDYSAIPLQAIERIEIESGKRIEGMETAAIFPANLYVAPKDRMHQIIHEIEDELYEQENIRNKVIATPHKTLDIKGKSRPVSTWIVKDVVSPYRETMSEYMQQMLLAKGT